MHRLVVFVFSVFVIFSQSSLAASAWYENVDLSRYQHIDQKNKIPELAKKKALAYYELYKDQIPNKDYLTIFDASLISSQPRMHIVHMASGQIESFLVAHGQGSDRDHDGYAESFSNAIGSHATSTGFYFTMGTYFGSNGYSLRLDGLEATNSNAEKRAVVIHGADYVNPQLAMAQNKIGRSQGCPAVELKFTNYIINKIKNGSVFYIWTP